MVIRVVKDTILGVAIQAGIAIAGMIGAVEWVVAVISARRIVGRAMRIIIRPVVVDMRSCSSFSIEVVVQEGALDTDDIGKATGQGIAAVRIGVNKAVVVKEDGFERVGSAILVDFGRDLGKQMLSGAVFIHCRVGGRVGTGAASTRIIGSERRIGVAEVIFIRRIAARTVGTYIAGDFVQRQRTHHAGRIRSPTIILRVVAAHQGRRSDGRSTIALIILAGIGSGPLSLIGSHILRQVVEIHRAVDLIEAAQRADAILNLLNS